MKLTGVMKILVMAAIAIALSLQAAQASECSGFGSITHTGQTVTVKPGSYNYVGVSLFNCRDDDLLVDISVDNLPKGWWFDIESSGTVGTSAIYLESQVPTTNPSGGGEWFILEDGASYIRTVPVRLKIGVPASAWGGLYTLKVTAFASPASGGGSGGFSIVPKFGREFNFYIQVPAPYKPQEDQATQTTTAATENIIDDLSSKVAQKNSLDDSMKKKSTDVATGDDNPSVIQGTENIEKVPKNDDGITGLSIGGAGGGTIIIIFVIILVIGALLFYLRR